MDSSPPSRWNCIKLKTGLDESESVFVCLCVSEYQVSNLMHTLRAENKSVICFPCDGEYQNIRHKAAGAFLLFTRCVPISVPGKWQLFNLKFKV